MEKGVTTKTEKGRHLKISYQFEIIYFLDKFTIIIKNMKIIFSKNRLRDLAKMLHLIKQSKYFLLIYGRFFDHFYPKNQCLVNIEY